VVRTSFAAETGTTSKILELLHYQTVKSRSSKISSTINIDHEATQFHSTWQRRSKPTLLKVKAKSQSPLLFFSFTVLVCTSVSRGPRQIAWDKQENKTPTFTLRILWPKTTKLKFQVFVFSFTPKFSQKVNRAKNYS
jgi:hypothetical protein